MAKIDEIIPFILHFEAGVDKRYLSLPPAQIFEQAKKTGFANDPDDAGGATMCGITIETYKTYCKRKGYPVPTVTRLRSITYEQWLDVLKTLFWDKWMADSIRNQALANILVDWVWASGINGIKIPQRILGVKQDGIVGPITLEAVNTSDYKKLFDEIHEARIKFVEDIVSRKPNQKKFINGWKRRINAITFTGLNYS